MSRGVDTATATTYVNFALPEARKAGEFVEDVPELVSKLQNEAKVL